MGPGPEGREERRSEPPGCHVNLPPGPFTFSPGPSKTRAEQGSLGVSGQPCWKKGKSLSSILLQVDDSLVLFGKFWIQVHCAEGAEQGLTKLRAGQDPIIQTVLYVGLFPCARLCAKHITCLHPTATLL